MSKNCLVTRLKGTVSNDSLEELGILKVVCEAGECEFIVGLASGTLITCDNTVDTIKMNNVAISFPYTAGTIARGDFLQKITGTLTRKTTFKFNNLYNNRSMALYNNPMTKSITKSAIEVGISDNEDFRYLRIDSNYAEKDYVVDLSTLNNKIYLNTVSLVGTAKGNISAFSGIHEYLGKVDLGYNSKVSGNISSFAGCAALTILSFEYSNGITGTIESLAEGMITSGRTSGTLSVICNGVVTYSGTPVPNGTTKTITFSNGSYTVA